METQTLGDLGKLLSEHGIDLRDVKGVRVVPEQRGDLTSPLFLEVKRYLHDDDGKRFIVRWPNGDRSVAYERIRLPLSALATVDEAHTFDPPVEFYDGDRNFILCHASDIIEDQRPKRKVASQ